MEGEEGKGGCLQLSALSQRFGVRVIGRVSGRRGGVWCGRCLPLEAETSTSRKPSWGSHWCTRAAIVSVTQQNARKKKRQRGCWVQDADCSCRLQIAEIFSIRVDRPTQNGQGPMADLQLVPVGIHWRRNGALLPSALRLRVRVRIGCALDRPPTLSTTRAASAKPRRG